jgi:anaerobic selenocysteine-containing dehydrogenase
MPAAPGERTTVQTTCPYCGVGCGVLATRHSDGRVEVHGDPENAQCDGQQSIKPERFRELMEGLSSIACFEKRVI